MVVVVVDKKWDDSAKETAWDSVSAAAKTSRCEEEESRETSHFIGQLTVRPLLRCQHGGSKVPGRTQTCCSVTLREEGDAGGGTADRTQSFQQQ